MVFLDLDILGKDKYYLPLTIYEFVVITYVLEISKFLNVMKVRMP